MCNEPENKMKENSSFCINQQLFGPHTKRKIIKHVENSTYWHKFTITDIKTCEASIVQKAITDFLHPSYPVNFKKTKKRGVFYASHCLDAIIKLVSNSFKIPYPATNSFMKVTVFLNWCPYDLLDVSSKTSLANIVLQRFSGEKGKIVDLTAFASQSGSNILWSLNDPEKFSTVLQIVRDLEPHKLILQKNNIRNLNPLIALRTDTLTGINLQDNQIANFEALEPLSQFQELKEITLSKNPICKGLDYSNYVIPLKKMFPKLIVIDSVNISEGPPLLNNFLCSYEAGDLIEQFLEYFFTVYDKDDRSEIEDLYHENAMFSVTCRIIPEHASSKTAKLSQYFAINRNLFSPSISFGSSDKFLFRGRNSIMELYERLPRSYHDPLRIKTDLIFYSVQYAVLVVCGVFREEGQCLGFSRNFVLKCDDKQQYYIVNEQLHVYNASEKQLQNSYKKPRRIQFTGVPVPFVQAQYRELNNAVQLITNLNSDYSRRLLEEFHYDLKMALAIFINRHINNEIPEEAFQNGDRELQNNSLKALSPSATLVAKTIKQKGKFSNENLWRMLTDERLAMTTTKRERAQENTTDAFHIRNGLVKEAVIVKTEADCEKIVPSKTKRQPRKKKDKRCSPKYL